LSFQASLQASQNGWVRIGSAALSVPNIPKRAGFKAIYNRAKGLRESYRHSGGV